MSDAPGQLRQENEMLKTMLLKMETRLARANSLIDIENSSEVSMVTGWPDAIMERVSLYVSNQSALFTTLRSIQDQPPRCVIEESKASGVPVYPWVGYL